MTVLRVVDRPGVAQEGAHALDDLKMGDEVMAVHIGEVPQPGDVHAQLIARSIFGASWAVYRCCTVKAARRLL